MDGADPPGAGEAVPSRRLTCLVKSRSAGSKHYSNVEGRAFSHRVDMRLSGRQAFDLLAPQLLTEKARRDRLRLEEVGLVQRNCLDAMRGTNFEDAVFVAESGGGLDESLSEVATNSTAGLLFHTIYTAPQGPLPPQQQVHHRPSAA